MQLRTFLKRCTEDNVAVGVKGSSAWHCVTSPLKALAWLKENRPDFLKRKVAESYPLILEKGVAVRIEGVPGINQRGDWGIQAENGKYWFRKEFEEGL